LTKYAPRGIRNQGRTLKRLLDELDQNRPVMAYFFESDVMVMMMNMKVISVSCTYTVDI
jgi:hypothetical protein